jgi:hypothetical protein
MLHLERKKQLNPALSNQEVYSFFLQFVFAKFKILDLWRFWLPLFLFLSFVNKFLKNKVNLAGLNLVQP